MDIFEAQRRARRWGALLTGLWLLLTALLVVPAYVLVWLLANGWPFATPLPGVDAPAWDAALGVPTIVSVVAAVFGGSTFHWMRLRRGGEVVARLMGGRAVPRDPTSPGERLLRNVTEEMAIAAGFSTPRLFVLPAEPGINAFSAGMRAEDAAVAVTAGALERLDRDELQTVVAHEVAHVLQGDTRVRTWSLALLHGFLFVSLAGAALVGGGLGRRGVRPGLPFFLGLGLLAAGSLGAGLGRVLQAVAGRQREYLADARAAQFTRAPHALASALRKTGGDPEAAAIRHHFRTETRHLLFSSGLSWRGGRLLATHPPLDARIRRVDPAWDGSYLHTRLPDDAEASIIARALELGRKTTIPEGSEWSGTAPGEARGPEPGRGGILETLERRTVRQPTGPELELRRRPPTVRLPPTPETPAAAAPVGTPAPPAEQIHSFLPVRREAAAVLVAVATRAHEDEARIRRALEEAVSALPGVEIEGNPGPGVPVGKEDHRSSRTAPEDLEASLAPLRRLSPGMLRRFFEGCAFAVNRDGTTTTEAAALLRELAGRLGVELPEAFQ